MGAFAEAVQQRLSETLAERLPAFDWTTEYYVSGTPVDVAGIDDGRLAVVELEWRRIRERSERMLVRERAKRVD